VRAHLVQEIRSIEQLRVVARQLGVSALVGGLPHVRFAIVGHSESSNREATERMSNYQGECGCFAGGLTMGAYVLAFIVLFIISGESPVGGGLQGLASFAALLVGSMLAGKVFGLLWARVRMIRLVRSLAARADR
jgi:F0F1-type ATP synthase assembly protein I